MFSVAGITEARAAETHRLRILSGDVNEPTENENEDREVRAAIRRRLDPNTRDTQFSKRR